MLAKFLTAATDMRLLITGGTGFIGQPLCRSLLNQGHELVVLSRSAARRASSQKVNPASLQFINSLDEVPGSQPFDGLINLAGEPIADKRWSDQQKANILESRLQTTAALRAYCERAEHKPGVLVNGSAIGYYGVGLGYDEVTESGTTDDSFSSEVCQRWETAAKEIEQLGVRTCLLRTGIVLGADGGALSRMLLPFKLGLGGPIGSGEQWMPWIHLQDMVSIINACLGEPELSGAINCTAPNPVTNKVFAKTLGQCLRRPAVLPLPGFVLSLAFGQMAEELLLAGKKIIPKKLSDHGFNYQFLDLHDALVDILDP